MRIVYKNKTGWGIAAREGLAVVTSHISHPVIYSEEVQTRSAADIFGAPKTAKVFAYFESPIWFWGWFWVGVVKHKDRFFAVSAAVRDNRIRRKAKERFRYFSFVYGPDFQFDHLVELPEMYPRCWMLILSATTKE